MNSGGERPGDDDVWQPLRDPNAEAKLRRSVEGMRSVSYQRHALAEGMRRIALLSGPEHATELLDATVVDVGADHGRVLATALVGLLAATTPRLSSAAMRAFSPLDGP